LYIQQNVTATLSRYRITSRFREVVAFLGTDDSCGAGNPARHGHRSLAQVKSAAVLENYSMVERYTARELLEAAERANTKPDVFLTVAAQIETMTEEKQQERRSDEEDKAKIGQKLDELNRAGLVNDDLLKDRRARADILREAGVRRNQGTMGFMRIAIGRILLLTHQPPPSTNGGGYRRAGA
jgi:hypothetical protein